MMGTWHFGKPGEKPCVICTELDGSYDVQPIFAVYENGEWVNALGETVENVVCWTEAPEIPTVLLKAKKAAEELNECYEKDTCENQDCLYFCRQDKIKAINDYFTGGKK